MPGKDHIGVLAGGAVASDDEGPGPSRRRLLAGAAGAGAAGVAVTMLSGLTPALAASDRRPPDDRAEHAGAVGATVDADGAQPVIAHVSDASTGQIDLFRGTGEVRLHDRDLAARILRAAGENSVR
jgi:hypothetical protein